MTRTKLAIGGAVLVVLGSAPFWGPLALREMSFFRVRRVEIIGARYLAPSDIIARLNVDTLASVWEPTHPLAARVEQYPGVAHANVRRKLPGTLVVEIVERVPVALVSAPTGLRAYDDHGTALPIDPTRVAVDAPVLMERDVPLLKLLGSMRANMPAMYARVSGARRPGHGEIALDLKPAGTGATQTETVRANDDLTLERLADVEPVEQDLSKKQLRATEIDLRFRDQVIARLP
ncbi:MAG TPA: FtsQ-type POTRA domain-containing protein [Gemmatimonadaceae bacterium]|jgi:cell division protein FtsQ|nr:FtsQ-type POTRA domain-containing protein [Gemmatimonadaceae bacterium]